MTKLENNGHTGTITIIHVHVYTHLNHKLSHSVKTSKHHLVKVIAYSISLADKIKKTYYM